MDEKITEEEARKKFEEWLEKFKRTSLSINRLPEKDKTEFIQIAKEEFADDYGFALREMKNTWKGMYINQNEELNAKIDLIAEEVKNLKEAFAKQTQKKQEKYKIAADGKTKIKIE